MSRAVVVSRTGGTGVLEVREVATPHAGAGRVRIAVRAEGLNPWDTKVRTGVVSVSLPSGQGSEFAGVVDEIGDGVVGFSIGDEVLGWTASRAQADHLVVPPSQLAPKPAGLDWALAGGVGLVANTAKRALDAVEPFDGETLLVTGASGAVGMLVAQFAIRAGLRVLGTAAPRNHDFVRSLGVEPVAYGDGELDRVHTAAVGARVDAAVDTVGATGVALALALDVAASRIDSVAFQPGPADPPTLTVGGGGKTSAELADFALDAAAGRLVLPVRATFPLARVREAYDELENGRGVGKVVLTVP